MVSLPSVHMDKQRGCTNTARDVVRCCEELVTRVRRCRDRGARALWDVTEDL